MRWTRTASRGGARTGNRAIRCATVGATLGLVAALSVVVAGLGEDEGEAVEQVADRPELPLGSPDPGYVGAEDSAIELATEFSAIERAPGEACPDEDVRVDWDGAGTADYETGAHYAPVGPRPEANESANGILYCEGSTYDYSGFSSSWDGTRWQVDLAPDLGDDIEGPSDDGHQPSNPDGPVDNPDAPLPVPEAPSDLPTDLIDRLDATVDEIADIGDLELTEPWQQIFDEFPIEELAPYEPQTECSPSPKAGTYGFSEILLDTFTSTGSSGISRACNVGARSEHKEGRAFDWTALVSDAPDRRAVSQVIGWLLAADEHGEPYAMARRLGLMYVIYNNSIWRSYAPEQGWVGYTGPNPHTDHVHFSFSRAGGLGETSFWDVAELPDVSALDFGPYALLPDAGGVSVDRHQPAVQHGDVDLPGTGGGGRPRPQLPQVPGGGGGGGDDPVPTPPSTPSLPTPTLPSLPIPTPTLPPVTLPSLPPVTLPGLPNCPPGTPLLPLPTDCLLPGRNRP